MPLTFHRIRIVGVLACVTLSSCGDGRDAARGDAGIDATDLRDGHWAERFIVPGINGQGPGLMAAARMPTGDILVGGLFSYGGAKPARNVATWNEPDGWQALGDGAPGQVSAVAISPNGEPWIAYTVSSPDFSSHRQEIARWGGFAWTIVAMVQLAQELAEPARSGVQRMAFGSNGELVVAGEFAGIDGANVSNLAVLEGGSWSGRGEPPDGPVYALLVESGGFCVGGSFSGIGGIAARQVACWDGAVWSGRDLIGTDGAGLVQALARGPDGALYAAGEFYLSEPDTFDGGSAARWTGSSWQLVGRGLGIFSLFQARNEAGRVRDIAWIGGELIAGGTFTNAGGTGPDGTPTVSVEHLASFNLETGDWTDAGRAPLNVGFAVDGDNVFAIGGVEGEVYAAGVFSSVGGEPAYNVARRTESGWQALVTPGEPADGVEGAVTSLVSDGGRGLFLGGSFARAGDLAASNVARFDHERGYSALGAGLEGRVTALALDSASGDLFAAETVCVELPDLLDCANFRVSRWNGSSWTTVSNVRPGVLLSLSVAADGTLFGAGSVVETDETRHVVRWDGQEWVQLGGDTDDVATSLLMDADGTIVVGGLFERAGDQPARHVARFDGEAWQPLGEGLESPVLALTQYRGRVVAGMQKRFAADPASALVATWDGARWIDIGGELAEGAQSPQIKALIAAGDALVATGQFPLLGGVALYDGISWTQLGSGMNQFGEALALRSEGLYVGGGFTTVDGAPAVGLGLLQPDR